MKVRAGTTAAALVVGRVAAQQAPEYGGGVSTTPSSSRTPAPFPTPYQTPSWTPSSYESVSYTTLTLDECPTGSFSTSITVTEGITVTYCPECEKHSLTTKPKHAGTGYTTVYTTTYLSDCSTGMTPVTYTVTESCTDDEPTWTPGPSHIPDGFVVTTKHCSACEEGSKTVTVTEPCGCEATGGKSIGPAKPAKTTPAAPVQQISDGQVQAPTPGGGSGSTPTKPTSSPECDGEDCGGSGSGSISPSGGNDGGSGSTPSSPSTGGSFPASECDGENCDGSGSGSSPSSPAGNTPVAPGTSGAASAPPYPTTGASESGRVKATGGAGRTDVVPLPSSTTSAITPAPYDSGAGQMGVAVSIMLSVVVGALAFLL